MIVGVSGFIGSGKNSVADRLVQLGFIQTSFASPLKDAVATTFGWDREMLEGSTDESRQWRETVDSWWSERLSLPQLTPRWVLQQWGTDVLRTAFHDDIWIASCEKRILQCGRNVVISDVRFPNEVYALKKMGGIILRVKRGSDPEWWTAAERAAHLPPISPEHRAAMAIIKNAGVHESEWSLAGTEVDYVICNDGTLDELYDQVGTVLSAHLSE